MTTNNRESGEASFAEIAVACMLAAHGQVIQVSHAEYMLAGCEHGFGLTVGLADMRRQAELLGLAHKLFKQLSAREDEIRRLLAGDSSNENHLRVVASN